jgi:cell division protein FtsQ
MARSIAAPAPSRRPGRGWLLPSLRPSRLSRVPHAPVRAVAQVFAAVWRRRRARIALLSALVALPLLGGAWLWLRHSSLVAVEHVRIDGLAVGQGMEKGAIETALTGAARRMSTLDVKQATLRAAVAQYPIVRAVHARARVPHGLDVEVVEQPPVAALEVGAARTAVAADGVVLGPAYLTSSLPLAHGAAAAIPGIGHALRGGTVLAELRALGAAPGPLAREVTNAYYGSRGLTLAFKGGLVAYFGDASRARAKWVSLARVLADPGSAGASYVDVRLPERPAAGFPTGTVAPDGSSVEAGQSSGTDPATAAELAAGLNAAVAGGLSSNSAAGAATAPATSEAGSGAEAGANGEAGSGAEAAAGGEAGAGSETGAEAGAAGEATGGGETPSGG